MPAVGLGTGSSPHTAAAAAEKSATDVRPVGPPFTAIALPGWRDASARAFAVRWTSCMNAGVVGSVSATVLSPACRAYPVTAIPRDILLLRSVRVERPHVISAVNDAHWRVNSATRTLQYQGVRVRLHCISLARAERSRICSDGDVMRGCGGDRQYSPAEFQGRRTPASPAHSRHCALRAACRRPHWRCLSGRASPNSARGYGFGTHQVGAKPAPAHLQCKYQFSRRTKYAERRIPDR